MSPKSLRGRVGFLGLAFDRIKTLCIAYQSSIPWFSVISRQARHSSDWRRVYPSTRLEHSYSLGCSGDVEWALVKRILAFLVGTARGRGSKIIDLARPLNEILHDLRPNGPSCCVVEKDITVLLMLGIL